MISAILVNAILLHKITKFATPEEIYSDIKSNPVFSIESAYVCLKIGIKIRSSSTYALWTNGLVDENYFAQFAYKNAFDLLV